MRDALAAFLDNGDGKIRFDVIPHWLPKLHAIRDWFENQTSFNFYSSSILLIYDGAIPPVEGITSPCAQYAQHTHNTTQHTHQIRRRLSRTRLSFCLIIGTSGAPTGPRPRCRHSIRL